MYELSIQNRIIDNGDNSSDLITPTQAPAVWEALKEFVQTPEARVDSSSGIGF